MVTNDTQKLNKTNRHKLHAPSNQRPTDGPTDRWTDQGTNRPTNTVAYRDACTRLKISRNDFPRMNTCSPVVKAFYSPKLMS